MSPARAGRWRATSTQTAIHADKVLRLADEILFDRWQPNRHRDHPVAFDGNRLCAGNHRLLAVLNAGRPAWMWVQGVPPDER